MTHPSMHASQRRRIPDVIRLAIPMGLFAGTSLASTIHWERTAIPLPESIWSVAASDINLDGSLDFIAMGEKTVYGLLAPDWKIHRLIDTREPKLLYCAALDADSDGDLDIALGRYRVPWIEYREALKSGRTVEKPLGPDFSLAWIENIGSTQTPWPLHVLDREFNGIHGLAVGDVNRDGKFDLLAGSISGPTFSKSLGWFEVAGDISDKARRHIITQGGADGRPHYLDYADLNGDGLGDLLVGDSGGGTFTWWQRPSHPDEPWKKHLISKEPGATNIVAGDVNGDGLLDIIASCGHGTGVFWFEAPDWKKHGIDRQIRDPHALTAADFDGDQDLDVAMASFGEKKVRWYENRHPDDWLAHDIDTQHNQQAYDLKTADLDGDDRIDLILAGRESKNAVYYRNTSLP